MMTCSEECANEFELLVGWCTELLPTITGQASLQHPTHPHALQLETSAVRWNPWYHDFLSSCRSASVPTSDKVSDVGNNHPQTQVDTTPLITPSTMSMILLVALLVVVGGVLVGIVANRGRSRGSALGSVKRRREEQQEQEHTPETSKLRIGGADQHAIDIATFSGLESSKVDSPLALSMYEAPSAATAWLLPPPKPQVATAPKAVGDVTGGQWHTPATGPADKMLDGTRGQQWDWSHWPTSAATEKAAAHPVATHASIMLKQQEQRHEKEQKLLMKRQVRTPVYPALHAQCMVT